MKIGFLLQRRFAYIGHELAKLLKERYGVTDFCGYTSLHTSYEFLKSQIDIKYTGLVFEEEIYSRYKNEKLDINYLKNFEKEYGLPNLWTYINLDRVIRYNLLVREYPWDKPVYAHEEMLRIFQATAKAVTKFLDEEKPDCLIFSVIANISSLLLYKLAKKRNIKTLILDAARIGNKYFWTEEYDRSTYALSSFENFKKGFLQAGDQNYKNKAAEFLSTFQREKKYYFETSGAFSAFKKSAKFSSNFNFLLPNNFLRFLRWIFLSVKEFIKHRSDYTTVNPFYQLIDKIKRKLRIFRGYQDLYDVICPDEEYAYFPLHTEPEAYPMLLAPFYNDQLWLLKQVSRSLPAHFKLYVKDHPSMLGYRTRNYYKEIKKIPNVKLIDPLINSLGLIEKSKLVITLLGTSGWEAALLKKPVIIFGKIYYDCLSAVKRCVAIEDLPYLVQEQLEKFTYNQEELINFISALLKESVDIDLVRLWDLEGGGKLDQRRAELVPLVDLIAKKLGL